MHRLPKCVQDIPVISHAEATYLLKEEGYRFAGFSCLIKERPEMPDSWSHPGRSFSTITVDRGKVGDWKENFYRLFDHPELMPAWVNHICSIEIEEMFDMEERGEKLLFYVNKYALEHGWYNDHVYAKACVSKDHPGFGFTVWELRHLIPMFPDVVMLVDPEGVE